MTVALDLIVFQEYLDGRAFRGRTYTHFALHAQPRAYNVCNRIQKRRPEQAEIIAIASMS